VRNPKKKGNRFLGGGITVQDNWEYLLGAGAKAGAEETSRARSTCIKGKEET